MADTPDKPQIPSNPIENPDKGDPRKNIPEIDPKPSKVPEIDPQPGMPEKKLPPDPQIRS
jgi:hypothetical protein